MSDFIEALPIDEYPMNPQEQQLFNSVIANNGSIHRILQDLRTTILAAILFFVLNLEGVNMVIENTVSYAKSSKTSLLFVKTFMFVIGVFMINNGHLLG